MTRIHEILQRFTLYNRIIGVSRKICLPGFDGLSVYEVGVFFAAGLVNGAITTRAASIAYRFFLGLFPAVLFVISLIPYIPVPGFQEGVIQVVTDAFPAELGVFVEDTIRDVVMEQRTGLLSATFVFSLYMASRGVLGIIRSFDAGYHDVDTHPRAYQWLVSIGLVFVFGMLLLVASVAQIVGGALMDRFAEVGLIPGGVYTFLLDVARLLLVALLLFLAISALYYWARVKHSRYRFITAGSSLATLAVLVVNAGFNIYLSNLSRWNAIFGSLGTIIVLLIWMYANSLVVLIGFELNISISEARHSQAREDGGDHTPEA